MVGSMLALPVLRARRTRRAPPVACRPCPPPPPTRWPTWPRSRASGSAMAAARDGIDALLRDRGLRRTAPELTTESLLRGAHASAVLDGLGRDPRRGSARATGDADRLGRAAGVDRAAGARPGAQAVPAPGVRPAAHAGGQGHRRRRRARPAARRRSAAERLAELARLLLAPDQGAGAGGGRGGPRRAARRSAPFASHNGVVARAAERLVMVARGVDPTSLTVPEAGHLALRAAYESNLARLRRGRRRGVHAWLLYAAEAFTAGAQASPLRDRLTVRTDMRAAPPRGCRC